VFSSKIYVIQDTKNTYNVNMQLYLEVAIADPSYHGKEALTYATNVSVGVGMVVVVPLRDRPVLAIVTAIVKKPRFAVKDILTAASPIPLPFELVELILWMQKYYASSIGATAQLFVPSKIVEVASDVKLAKPSYTALPTLTNEQNAALHGIGDFGMHLLHGDTGTGKTRVYIELTRRALSQNRSAIILTPEIGLTSQLAQDFGKIFGDRVVVLHSQLKETDRRQIWSFILATDEPVIVIGARSALFAPVSNLGLIVIDEAHETAYKQDQAPYYHATRVASKLADLHKATIVLGSATPLVSDYYMARQKQRPIIRMSQSAVTTQRSSRSLSVVDLRDRNNQSRKPYLSNKLVDAITERLTRHEQILLFLNRRGTARVVICSNCGWQALCPKCDLALTYHGDIHAMRCHSCDYKSPLPNNCPKCQNPEIILKSIGTKAVTDDVMSLFPEARVMRFDTDNSKSERIEQHYEAIRSGEVDIIIGTQTLAKGLDLPNLGLVGVVIADTSLYFPDFSAQERTYELLYQVIGRVGRGHRQSEAIIQTYMPENLVIRQVMANDWDEFYNNEIAERTQFLFPPFCHLLKLSCKRASAQAAQTAARKLANRLIDSSLRIVVEGPSPCFHERINNKYSWQIVIKTRNRAELLKVIEELPSGWSYDIDPMNLL
jgi:primosomal protein N' (replication factor Y)